MSLRVSACAHGGLVPSGKHKGKALKKKWRIETTMPGLDDALQIPCPKGLEFVDTVGGKLSLLSSKYPSGMAKAFHEVFANASRHTEPIMLASISCL